MWFKMFVYRGRVLQYFKESLNWNRKQLAFICEIPDFSSRRLLALTEISTICRQPGENRKLSKPLIARFENNELGNFKFKPNSVK